MKLRLFTTFLFTQLLFGCGYQSSENIQLTGSLKPLGEITIEGKSDHVIETYDGEIYYVYSDFLNLDKGSYLDNQVQVSGKVVGMTGSDKSVIAIQSVVVIEPEFIAKDIKEEKPKKYQNLEAGFKLSDLVNWSTENQSFEYTKLTKDGATIEVNVYENSTGMSLESWTELSSVSPLTPTLLGVDNLKSYKFEGDGTIIYYISRTNKQIFQLTLTYISENQRIELLSIAKSIRFMPTQAR